ncbi:MAG: hypothetical protein KJ060_02540 [Candidatus Hydrogenedentes bacterium]|nr:hypothetical protein [Candidatus Hydrogenedentota bacterium]
MRAVSLCLILLAVAASAFAQVPQTIADTELTRYLDRAAKAMRTASQDAAANDTRALRESLKRAQELWMDCYGKYREWVSADTNWRADFDAISTSMTNAVNALTPGNNIPNAKLQIDAALAKLNALRDRNGVPDLEATADDVAKSLEGMQATAKSLQGKRLTVDDLSTLQKSYEETTTSWQRFTSALVDVNALGLSSGELDRFKQLVAVQNIKFDTINYVLKDPDTARLVAELQSARDQLAQLVEELDPNLTDSTGDEPVEDSEFADDSGDAGIGEKGGLGRPGGLRDRPRLLPRRR